MVSQIFNALTTVISFKLLHQVHFTRSFVNAKIKWVRDPYLDTVVQKEKDLKQVILLKDQILSSPSKILPLSTASLLKRQLDLPTTTAKFIEKYPYIFTQFQPESGLHPHIKLTPLALTVQKEELAVHTSTIHRDESIERLVKLLLLTGVSRLPFYVIDRLKWDLGLPHNYVSTLVADYPDYFEVCGIEEPSGNEVLGLKLVSCGKELVFSELEKRAMKSDTIGSKRRHDIKFPMSLPKGFDFDKRVMTWVAAWQKLPYISPYENGFHLEPNSDQAEKWIVAVLHELLWLLVSKKTETQNLFCLGDFLGCGSRFKKALAHHPGIFYLSNKIRTQTVVLREAYKKDFLVDKHMLMGMRYRYIHLMTKERIRCKPYPCA